MPDSETVQVPDLAVREIGALHLQLSLAQQENAAMVQRIAALEQEIATITAAKPAPEG